MFSLVSSGSDVRSEAVATLWILLASLKCLKQSSPGVHSTASKRIHSISHNGPVTYGSLCLLFQREAQKVGFNQLLTSDKAQMCSFLHQMIPCPAQKSYPSELSPSLVLCGVCYTAVLRRRRSIEF